MSDIDIHQLGKSRWRSVDAEILRLRREITGLTSERDALRGKVEGVRELHQSCGGFCNHCTMLAFTMRKDDDAGLQYHAISWPCATILALGDPKEQG